MKNLGLSVMAALAAFAIGHGAARADILIAIAGPITGEYATFGDQMKRGGEMAVNDINAKGGVLGQQLKLEIGDDACDPKQAVAVANKLVSDGVVFVDGDYCSSSSIPASDVYNDGAVIQISPASTNPQLTDRGLPGVFRTCGRDDQQGAVAGAYLYDHFRTKKIAFLNDKSTYGKGLADQTLMTFNKLGGKEAMVEAYTAGEKDYSALVSKLKAAGIDVIYLGGYHTEAGLILRQSAEQGYHPQMVSGDAMMSKEFWQIAGPAGEGMLMTFSPDPRKNPEAQPVVAKFKQSGNDAEGYTLYTYGAIQAWAQAVERAKSTDFKKVAAELHRGSFDTVLGKIAFDQKGDVRAPGYVFYVWHNGDYQYAPK